MLGLRARWGEVAGRDSGPAAPAPGSGAARGGTEVLDTLVAGSWTDPAADTEVLGPGPTIGRRLPEGEAPDATRPDATPHSDATARKEATRLPNTPEERDATEQPDAPPARPVSLVSRRVAAEIGIYTGAALVLVSVIGVVARGWTDWEPAVRGVFAGLATVALVSAGLFVRLPWSRPLSDERRRAVSALLVTGVAGALTAMAAAPGSGAGVLSAGAGEAARAVGVLLAVLMANLVARTPVSESALLGALAWVAWVATPPGPGTWAVLVGLGAAWAAAGLGARWARGRRTALVLGSTLALLASVGMAAGPWAVPTRAALGVVVVLGLGGFLRGRANHWLALGAGAATALAASVAGDVVGPALALLVGGLATMAVSWIALRAARRG